MCISITNYLKGEYYEVIFLVVNPGGPATFDFRAMFPGRKTRNGKIPGRKARNGWFGKLNSLLSQVTRIEKIPGRKAVMGGLLG